jgi:hypothetical protein
MGLGRVGEVVCFGRMPGSWIGGVVCPRVMGRWVA